MTFDEDRLRGLMLAGLGGDADRQRELLRALLPVLRRFYARRASDADVEDLVQTALIAVHQRRSSYDPDRRFGPWLFAVARYKLVDHLRRTRPDVALAVIEATHASEAAEFDAADARMDIDAALATLPPKQAAALRAIRIEGLSAEEAAERQAITPSDVRVSAHRELRALIARFKGGS